ncbi:MAG TPA: PAS domain S-box protein [Candidatus Binatia bacterium]|nr:PAS domain S-box protein [Candidatus Binatia bacterium]
MSEISELSRGETGEKASVANALKELGSGLEELKVAQEKLDRQHDAMVSDHQKLEIESRRYRDLFDLAPTPYLVTDFKGIILEANHAAGALLNTRQDFLIGKPLHLYLETDAKSDVLGRLADLRQRGQFRDWRLRLQPRRGAPIAVSVSVSVQYFEKTRATDRKLELQWVVQDLTEQEKAADTLRESEEKYRSLFENAQEGICRTTPDGRFTAANPALARMLGYDVPEDLLALRVAGFLYADPAEHKRLLHELEDAPEKALRNRELLLKRKDGSPMRASLSIRGICDSGGRIVAYESLVQDITERKRMEERLQQRERLAAVGSTVAVLTHEISNPLNAMYAIIQMMERQMAGNKNQHPALISHLRDLSLETHRLGELLKDFRLLAQTQYTFEPVSVRELITEVLNLQTVNYSESRVQVEVDVPESLPAIIADKNKLKQALLNLCKNGVEAMADGGLLTIRGTKDDSQVVLEIRDTGSGIPNEIDVFEPFVTTKEYGTGLGLPIVRQIISSHGGSIVHSSEPGKGTTFRLILPIEQKS